MKREHFELLWRLCEWETECLLPGPEIVTDLPAEYYEIWEKEGIISPPFTPRFIHIPEHGIVGFPRKVVQIDEDFYCVYDEHYIPKENMIPPMPGSTMHRIYRERLACHMAQQWGIDFEYRKLADGTACLVGWKNNEMAIVLITHQIGYPVGHALQIKIVLDAQRLFVLTVLDGDLLGERDIVDYLAPQGILYERTITFLTDDGYPRWEQSEKEHYRLRLFDTPWDYDPKDDLIYYSRVELSLPEKLHKFLRLLLMEYPAWVSRELLIDEIYGAVDEDDEDYDDGEEPKGFHDQNLTRLYSRLANEALTPERAAWIDGKPGKGYRIRKPE